MNLPPPPPQPISSPMPPNDSRGQMYPPSSSSSSSDVFEIWSKQGASSTAAVQQQHCQSHNNTNNNNIQQQPYRRSISQQNSPDPTFPRKQLLPYTQNSDKLLQQPPLPPNRARLNTDPTDLSSMYANNNNININTDSNNNEDIVKQLQAQLAQCQSDLEEARAKASTPQPSNSIRSRLNTSESIQSRSSTNKQREATTTTSISSTTLQTIRRANTASPNAQQSNNNNRIRLDTTDSDATYTLPPIFNTMSTEKSSTSPYHQFMNDSHRTQRASNVRKPQHISNQAPQSQTPTIDLLDVDNFSTQQQQIRDIPTPTAANKTPMRSLKRSPPPPMPIFPGEQAEGGDKDDNFGDNDESDGVGMNATIDCLKDDSNIHNNDNIQVLSHDNQVNTVEEFTSIVDQMKSVRPPEHGPRRSTSDEATDVSSLTDAVSYQQSGVGSAMAALLRKPKGSLRRVVGSRRMIMGAPPQPVDRHDTVTTAATSSSIGPLSLDRHSTTHTLETIDQSLEQHLYESGSKKSFGSSSIRNMKQQQTQHMKRLSLPLEGVGGRQGFAANNDHAKLGLGFSSPLDEAIAIEKSLSSRGGIANSNSHSRYHSHHHHRSNSNGSGGSKGKGSTSRDIQNSWLVPRERHQHHQSSYSPGTLGTQPLTESSTTQTPQPGEDLIDVSCDEPIDPFSGLIGMPRSIGCESSVISGDDDTVSTGGGIWNNVFNATLSRPPIGKTRSKSETVPAVSDAFDPLHLEEIVETEVLTTTSIHSTSISSSPLRPSFMPPRHHKDDPLLAKSRYRHSLISTGQSKTPPTSKKSKSMRHRRSSSAGSGAAAAAARPSLGNSCMFGSIAQLEAQNVKPLVISTTPMNMTRNISCTSLETLDQLSIGVEARGSSLERTPNSDQRELADVTPKEDDNNDDDDDNSSYGSFGEEYNRAVQPLKAEFKHIVKPVANIGRKLFRRGNDDAAMKRADGCLT